MDAKASDFSKILNNLFQPIQPAEEPKQENFDLEDEELMQTRICLANIKSELVQMKEDFQANMTAERKQITKTLHNKFEDYIKTVVQPSVMRLENEVRKTLESYLDLIKSIRYYKQNSESILVLLTNELESFITSYLELNDRIRTLEDVTFAEAIDYDKSTLINIIMNNLQINVEEIIWLPLGKVNFINNSTRIIDQSQIQDPNSSQVVSTLLLRILQDFIDTLEIRFIEQLDSMFEEKLVFVNSEIDKKIAKVESYLVHDNNLLRFYLADIYKFLLYDYNSLMRDLKAKMIKTTTEDEIVKAINVSWDTVELQVEELKSVPIKRIRFKDYIYLDEFSKIVDNLFTKSIKKLNNLDIENNALTHNFKLISSQDLVETVDKMDDLNHILILKIANLICLPSSSDQLIYCIYEPEILNDLLTSVETITKANLVFVTIPDSISNSMKFFSDKQKKTTLLQYLGLKSLRNFPKNFGNKVYDISYKALLEAILSFFKNCITKFSNDNRVVLGSPAKQRSLADIKMDASPGKKLDLDFEGITECRSNVMINIAKQHSTSPFDTAYQDIMNKSLQIKSKYQDILEDSKIWIQKEENFINDIVEGKATFLCDKFEFFKSVLDPNYILLDKETSNAVFKEYMRNNNKYRIPADISQVKSLAGLIMFFAPSKENKFLTYLMIDLKTKRNILFYLQDELIDKPTKESLKTRAFIKYLKHQLTDEKGNTRIKDKLSRADPVYRKIKTDHATSLINCYFPFLSLYNSSLAQPISNILAIERSMATFNLYTYMSLLISVSNNLFSEVKKYKYHDYIDNNRASFIEEDPNPDNAIKEYVMNNVEFFENYADMEYFLAKMLNIFLKHRIIGNRINIITTLIQKENGQLENIVLLSIASLPANSTKDVTGNIDIMCESQSTSDNLRHFVKKELKNDNCYGFKINHRHISKSMFPCLLGSWFLPGLLISTYDIANAFSMCNFCPTLTMHYLAEMNETMKTTNDKLQIHYAKTLVSPSSPLTSAKEVYTFLKPAIARLETMQIVYHYLNFRGIQMSHYRITNPSEIQKEINTLKKAPKSKSGRVSGESSPNKGTLGEPNIVIDGFMNSKEDIGYIAYFASSPSEISNITIIEVDFNSTLNQSKTKASVRKDRQNLVTNYATTVLEKKKIMLTIVYMNFVLDGPVQQYRNLFQLYSLDYLLDNNNSNIPSHSLTITENLFLGFIERNFHFFLKQEDNEFKNMISKLDSTKFLPFDIKDGVICGSNYYESIHSYKLSGTFNFILYLIQMGYPYTDFIYGMKMKQENLTLIVIHNRSVQNPGLQLKLLLFHRKESDFNNVNNLLTKMIKEVSMHNTIILDFAIIEYNFTNQPFCYFASLPCNYLVNPIMKKIIEMRRHSPEEDIVYKPIEDIICKIESWSNLLK